MNGGNDVTAKNKMAGDQKKTCIDDVESQSLDKATESSREIGMERCFKAGQGTLWAVINWDRYFDRNITSFT